MKLITRSDFDGLVSAVLLKEVMTLDDVEFAHPKDVQDGKIPVDDHTILTNLPYVPGCGLWFDHHSSETKRIEPDTEYKGMCKVAPSAARVVYDYYVSGYGKAFAKYHDLLTVVDKSDTADFTPEEVRNPQGWILLSFIMDARTNLGKYHDYRVSNRQLMHNMIDWIGDHTPEKILEFPDVKERVDRYDGLEQEFETFIKEHSYQEGKVIVTDTRGVEVPAGNRFLIHVWYPDALVALRVLDGKQNLFAVITGGYNIFDRSAKIDLGALMGKHGGGGHRAAATCQPAYTEVDSVLKAIIAAINEQEQ